MDVKVAFRNSPIWPPHKVFCVVEWQGTFFVDHIFSFSLATALGVQGCIVDVTVNVLKAWKICPVFKWVDDFNFMWEPCDTVTHEDGSISYFYAYNLADVIGCTDKLGIPWHPIDKKGHNFAFLATYVGLTGICMPVPCLYLNSSMRNTPLDCQPTLMLGKSHWTRP